MKKSKRVECPACEGDGEVMKRGVYCGRSLDPPMESCEFCRGKGMVSPALALAFDPEDECMPDYEDWC